MTSMSFTFPITSIELYIALLIGINTDTAELMTRPTKLGFIRDNRIRLCWDSYPLN